MNKNLLFLVFLFFTIDVNAEQARVSPGGYNIPEGRLDVNDFYYFSEIVNSDDYGGSLIRINIIVNLDMDDYDSYRDITDLLYDFESWPDYVNFYDGGDTVYFEGDDSLCPTGSCLSSEVIQGKNVYVHHALYNIPAPWPLKRQRVKEKTVYEETETAVSGMAVSIIFYPHPDFTETEGFVYKKGWISIKQNNEDNLYTIFLTVDVKTEFGLYGLELSKMQKPLTETFLAIFKGMYGIED